MCQIKTCPGTAFQSCRTRFAAFNGEEHCSRCAKVAARHAAAAKAVEERASAAKKAVGTGRTERDLRAWSRRAAAEGHLDRPLNVRAA